MKVAKDMESSALTLAEINPDLHVRVITEALFGSAHHYIAYGVQSKVGEHFDKHAGVPALLRRYGFNEEAASFEKLDSIRAGRFYGGKGDAGEVKVALELLEKIKRWAMI